jgi:lipopolysaccharide export LptBFGC system permease protein LptF
MQVSDIVQILAIIVECFIAGIAFLIAVRNKKTYGWFIAITFALFVLFDISRIFALAISPDIHSLMFLIACTVMLSGTWLFYREK